MARMGIFNRNDSTPENVPRSVQLLSYRNTFDTKYMQIVPNYVQYLYPNESISLRATNLVKSIPLNTPQLSNIRVVQRFVAVPLRLLWFAWEDYIKGENDSAFLYEEPYIINCMKSSPNATDYAQNLERPYGVRFYNEVTQLQTRFVARNFNSFDSKYCYGGTSETGIINKFGDYSTGYAQFGSHELGDYFGAPLYVPFGKVNGTFKDAFDMTDQVFSAFPFAAYQLAYSYFYRAPNVQTRIDDYYEMQNEESGEHEFPKGVAEIHQTSSNPVTFNSVNLSDEALATGITGFTRDNALQSDSTSVWLTSWDKVEHFPLKSGPNWSMLACRPNSTTGLPEYRASQICLWRKRYANWQSDNFTCCNPWQQRGDEVQIPVVSTSATVDLSGVNINVNSTATFTGTSEQVTGTFVSNGVETSIYGSGETIPSTPIYYAATNLTNTDDIYPEVDVTPQGTVTVESTAVMSGATVAGLSGLYVSPSSLKFALALQHVKELQAQIDNRYQSYIHKFFGARARDYRLDRPEFIGGMVQDLNVSQVTQTSESTDTSPMGTLAGLASSAKTSHTIRYHADEHTIVLGLIHIIPDTEYIGGLDREYNTQDRFDWMLPNFSHVAEQPVKNSELALTPFGVGNSVGYNPVEDTSTVTMDGAFGYEPVYNYLRWKKSMAVGAFRDTLNSRGNYEYYKPWLITRDFGFNFKGSTAHLSVNSPTLTDKFLSGRYNQDNSNFVVTDNESMYPFMVDSYFDVRMVRTIPSRGLPSKV